jgi:hypothetical protein
MPLLREDFLLRIALVGLHMNVATFLRFCDGWKTAQGLVSQITHKILTTSMAQNSFIICHEECQVSGIALWLGKDWNGCISAEPDAWIASIQWVNSH